jgi:hypothetical protein
MARCGQASGFEEAVLGAPPVCPVDRMKGSAGSGLSRTGLSIGRKDFNA